LAFPVGAATNYMPVFGSGGAGVSDLALIYQGGTHRPAWQPKDLAPYVSWTNPILAKEEWLFDGFLFIEYMDNRGHEFAKGYGHKPARKEDWAWLLGRNFEPNHGVAALEEVVAEATRRTGSPERRRQVVLTMPEPIPGQKDWGEIDGRALDFNRAEDRIAACAWQVKTALEHWQKLAPTHLELAGFYWVAEHSAGAASILPRIAEGIHQHGKRFFWIPYWTANGAQAWRATGFDVVYQQPNHFFNPKVPDSRLAQACEFARTNGMGLEMEFDANAIKSPEVYRPRLRAYLRAYEKAGAAQTAALAWYEGGGAFLGFYRSEDPEVRRLYMEVATWIATRQKAADRAYRQR
jgi:hypothetical protein